MSSRDTARTWVVRGGVVLFSVVGSACAADAGPMAGVGGVGLDAGSGGVGFAGAGGVGGMGATGGSGADACLANQTRPCTCVDGASGRAVCNTAAIWSLCDCGGGSAGSGGQGFDPGQNPAGNGRADIMFTWEQTVTDDCKPGRYEGDFSCNYVAMGGDPSQGILVTGPIVMTLAESESGEFLEITDGRLDGATFGVITFSSALSGRLNCSTKEFGASAEMGLWGVLIPTNPFDGVLDARYDGVTSTLSGAWALNEQLTMGVCTGPWNARWVSP